MSYEEEREKENGKGNGYDLKVRYHFGIRLVELKKTMEKLLDLPSVDYTT